MRAKVRARPANYVSPRLWPALALLPILGAPSFKAAGFRSVAGVDTTAFSILLLFLVSGVLFARKPDYPFRLLAPLLPLAGVVLIAVWRFSASYRVLPDDGRLVALLIALLVLAVVPLIVRDAHDLAGLNVVWIIVGTLTAFLTIVIGGASTIWGRGGINESYLGPAYLCGLGLVLSANAILSRSLPTQLMLPASLLCGIALVATGSRGPLVATAFGLIVALILNSRMRRSILALVVTGAVMVTGFMFASATSVANLTSPDLVRPRLAWIAYEGFLASPFVGGGWGSFAWDAASQGYVGVAYPHNLLLEVGAEYGALGLFALAAILAIGVARVMRARRNPAVVAAGVVLAYWFAGHQFSADLTDRSFWVALVVCLLVPGLVRRVSGASSLTAAKNPLLRSRTEAVTRPASGNRVPIAALPTRSTAGVMPQASEGVADSERDL